MKEQDITAAVRQVIESMKQTHMTLELANALIERVKAYAAQKKVAVVVAVSDSAGRPVAVQCMDGAYIASFDIAVNKTYTAISVKMPTSELARLCQPGADLYGLQYTNDGKMVIFGGGVLLEANGRIVGALGVSGGSAQVDTEIAEYGSSIFKEVLECL